MDLGGMKDRKDPEKNCNRSSHHTYCVTEVSMTSFLLWVLLLVVCWPIALIGLFLYPVVWLLLLPFRLLGFAVNGVLELVKALFLLPARILGR